MKSILKSVFAFATIFCFVLMVGEAATPQGQVVWSATFGLLTFVFGKITGTLMTKEEKEEQV